MTDKENDGLDFDALLGDGNTEFEDLALYLCKFMERGLASMPIQAQHQIAAHVEAGGEIVAVARTNPMTIAGLLSSNGQMFELFKVTESGVTH